jgi:tricorn protease
MKKVIVLMFSLLVVVASYSIDETRLLRFPAIYDNQIVFTYSGDLYTVNSEGGVARRLTDGEGLEIFARFSPDGSMIAFTGQYDGNTEVYIMPSEGGTPKRLTHTATLGRDDIGDRMGPNNIVMGFTPDGKHVVYRSRKKTFNSFIGHLFKVPVEGGMSEQLPFSTGSWCSFNETGDKLALNRIFREFRTWKYYKGGMADDIWVHNFNTHTTDRITKTDAQDIFPMWHGNNIYYLSDRDRIMNLFAYDTITKKSSKLTNFVKYDIKFPSLGQNEIVFENGGYIYSYSFSEKKVKLIPIKVLEDNIGSRTVLKDVSELSRDVSISPDGVRVSIAARGDIWSVPVESGITRNLTETSGVHERSVEWSPNGKYLAYISDKTGETEIYICVQDGSEQEIQLTENAETYKYNLKWSPDSKKIIWNDKMLRLRMIDIDSKKITEIHKSQIWEIGSYNWSPCNRYICFTDSDTSRVSQVFVYDTKKSETYTVTTKWYDSYSPVFSDDGKYLFFVSQRDFNPIYSSTEWNHAYRDMSRIYFITLTSDITSPIAPKNNEVSITEDKKSKEKEDKDKEEPVEIEFDNIEKRIGVLPVEAGNYWNIQVVEGKVYYSMNKFKHKSSLKMYNLGKQEEKELGNYSSWSLSADKKKMLIVSSGNYYVIDLPSGEIRLKDKVDLSAMKVWVDLKQEWKQIFTESWRQMRDFFYDPNMHGVDWISVYNKYEPLVEFVNDRNDLNYVIGEMIGELNVGHAYVGGGDVNKSERYKTGLLGAELTKSNEGYFRIDKILRGENWVSKTRSPLLEPGMNINEGDYIISINGKSLKDVPDIYALLVDKADKQVMLEINSKPSEKGVRQVLVVPIDDESSLYYYNWVQNNIDKVNEATNGMVGYIHVPDMSVEGLNEFVKYYYPQLSKPALIIDDRGNGGGNVSPMLIERLRRELSMMGMSRNVPNADAKPRGLHYGPKVLLVNEYSASDGDLFPYQFKKHKLGKIIGTRTWGGVVGIRGSLPFIDGGTLHKPEFAHYDETGWIIEGFGVEPDILVENDLYLEYLGDDAQLNKAIEVILYELDKFNKQKPAIPEFPDKSR